MKVYVITSGTYSDYTIHAVKLDEDEVKRTCALLNADRFNDDVCGIEEYDTDEVEVNTKEKVMWRFRMGVGYKTGNVYFTDYPALVLGDSNLICVRRGYPVGSESVINITATFPEGTHEDKAKKIIFDRISKFKAERAGI